MTIPFRHIIFLFIWILFKCVWQSVNLSIFWFRTWPIFPFWSYTPVYFSWMRGHPRHMGTFIHFAFYQLSCYLVRNFWINTGILPLLEFQILIRKKLQQEERKYHWMNQYQIKMVVPLAILHRTLQLFLLKGHLSWAQKM